MGVVQKMKVRREKEGRRRLDVVIMLI